MKQFSSKQKVSLAEGLQLSHELPQYKSPHSQDSEANPNGSASVALSCCFYGWVSAPCGAGCAAETKVFLLRAKLSHVSAAAEKP